MQTPTVSLYELNEFIRRVMALNFQEPVWIRAEVLHISFSREHSYLDLIEKGRDSEQIIAQSNAVLWKSQHQKLLKQHRQLLQDLLQPGLELRLLVRVEFDERYGLKLHIQDIDPQYTLGQLAVERRKTFETLQSSGMMDRNKQLPLSGVVQRIAVISSAQAAGWQDFREHLLHNGFGYTFGLSFYDAAVQGAEAAASITKRIREISSYPGRFDAIAIIRGGGSKLDLGVFDGIEIATAIAISPLPVLTGIGHDIDESMSDLVAWRSFKTPTAVADFLIERQWAFENRLLSLLNDVKHQTSQIFRTQEKKLIACMAQLKGQTSKKRFLAEKALDQISMQIRMLTHQKIGHSRQVLQMYQGAIAHLDPEQILKRGYSLVLKGDHIVKSSTEVLRDDELIIRFYRDRIKVKKQDETD